MTKMTKEISQALKEIQNNRKPNESLYDWVDRCNDLLKEKGLKDKYAYCPECGKPMEHHWEKVRPDFIFYRCIGCSK